MELPYTKQGDYLLPDLKLPQNPTLGKYAMMRRSFLKESRPGLYTRMMLSGSLNIHLTEVEQQAQAMMERLLTQLAKAEGVTEELNAHLNEIDEAAHARIELITKQVAAAQGITEELKARDQMAWVRRMNSITTRAEEIVRKQLICS